MKFNLFTSCSPGVPFQASPAGSSYSIDLFDPVDPSHLLIVTSARTGRSILISGFVVDCLAREIPAVLVGWECPSAYPSSYFEMVRFFQALGYSSSDRDLSAASGNLISLPDLSNTPQSGQRLELLFSIHKEAIRYLVLADEELSQQVTRTTVDLISDSYDAFQSRLDIQQRYAAALVGGAGSEASRRTPTLLDYLEFLSRWWGDQPLAEQVQVDCMSLILRQLQEKLSGELKDKIASPCLFNSDSMLSLLFSRDLGPTEIFAQSLHLFCAAVSRCLLSSESLLIIDGMNLCNLSDTIQRVILLVCSEGLELGIRVVIGDNRVGDMLENQSGLSLLDSFATKMIGPNCRSTLDDLTSIGFPPERSRRYLDHTWMDSFRELCSQWLLLNGSRCLDIKYFPKRLLLALMASFYDERMARERVLSLYPDDPLQGLQEFAAAYIPILQKGGDFGLIVSGDCDSASTVCSKSLELEEDGRDILLQDRYMKASNIEFSMKKIKKYGALIFVCITFLLGMLIWLGIARAVIQSQTIFIAYLPSAVLAGVLAFVPAIEYLRLKRQRLGGLTLRSGLVFWLDALFWRGHEFTSFSFEVAAVGLALIWVFYTPLIWRSLMRQKNDAN